MSPAKSRRSKLVELQYKRRQTVEATTCFVTVEFLNDYSFSHNKEKSPEAARIMTMGGGRALLPQA